jgi:cell division protein FtsB
MRQELIGFLQNQKKQLSDVRNIVLYVFALLVLAITWSTIKAIQANYELQKQISEIAQQNQVLSLENQNKALKNKYYETDAFLDLAARQNLGLAAPGEKVLIVPSAVAMKFVDRSVIASTKPQTTTPDTRSKYEKNIEAWRDFILGRKS